VKDLLREIRFVPEVAGSYVFSEKAGILDADLADKEFDDFLMQEAGRVLARFFRIRCKEGAHIDGVQISFGERSFICRMVGEGSFVIAVGSPDVNIDFVDMAIVGLLPELEKAVEEALKERTPAAPPPPKAAPAAVAPAAPAPKAQAAPAAKGKLPPIAPELRAALPRVQQALMRLMGPVAPEIMARSVQKWLATAPAAGARREDLETLLCAEIGDAAMELSFRIAMRDILGKVPAGAKAAAKGGASAVLPGNVVAGIQAALAKAIGPVAAIVMADCQKEWASKGGGAGVLVDLLCKEIGDAAQEKAFREEIKPLLP